jgi:hypothetical protein
MDVRLPAAVFTGLLSLAALPAGAAPFVAGDPQPVSVRIAASRAAVTVRPVVPGGPPAGWAVVSVLRDATDTVRPGQTVHPKPAPPAGTRLALLISNPDKTVEVVALSDQAAAYVAARVSPDAPVAERMRFAFSSLGTSDHFIATDAFAELARLEAADFDRNAELLPRNLLRRLVDDPDVTGERLALFGYLLGVCGEEEDAGRLRRRLLAADGLATGANGLAAGYLLLTREKGLAAVEANVLALRETSPLLVAAVFEAFAFLRSERPGLLDRDRLRKAASAALARPETADLAVGYLAAAREWAALPDVMALLNAEEDDSAVRRRAAQVAAVRFLEECRRDTDAADAVRLAADRALAQVAAADPDLVRRATVLSGGPAERR